MGEKALDVPCEFKSEAQVGALLIWIIYLFIYFGITVLASDFRQKNLQSATEHAVEAVTNPSRRKCAWGRPGTSRRCLAFREQTLDPCRDPAPTAPLSPNSDSNKPEATDLIPGMTGSPNKITRISRIYLKKKINVMFCY